MKICVTIGCSACSFKGKNNIEMPFDCDTLVCPKCSSENSLSIIKVHDEPSFFNNFDIQKRLQRMRKIQAG